MLQNDLFTFTYPITAGDVVKAGITLNTLHPIFKGHFPDDPILPGVCMMQMVKEITEAYTGKKIMLTKGLDLKFLSIVHPEENTMLQMELKINTEHEIIKIAAQLLHNTNVLFKFRGTFVQL